MTKKNRFKLPQELRDRVVDEYLLSTRSPQDIAKDHGIDVQYFYRWKSVREEEANGVRLEELVSQGNSF